MCFSAMNGHDLCRAKARNPFLACCAVSLKRNETNRPGSCGGGSGNLRGFRRGKRGGGSGGEDQGGLGTRLGQPCGRNVVVPANDNFHPVWLTSQPGVEAGNAFIALREQASQRDGNDASFA